MKIIRPFESTAEVQPQLHPAFAELFRYGFRTSHAADSACFALHTATEPNCDAVPKLV
jgi:hypothetical protein